MIEAPVSHPTLVFMGGTFDPPHIAHLLLARDVVEATGAETLYFVPAAQNPHKANGPVAGARHRLAMLEAATSTDPQLKVLDLELRRDGPSYTSDTVRELQRRFPERSLAWVIGADQLPGLPRWHAVEELVQAVEFLVMARPGHAPDAPSLAGLQWRSIVSRHLEISATEIRQRLNHGKPVDFFVPQSVLQYIHRNHLYTR